MKQIEMSGGTLHDQLKAAQSVTEKVKVLEQIINPLLLKIKELIEAHNDLVDKHDSLLQLQNLRVREAVERHDQLVAEYKMLRAELDQKPKSSKVNDWISSRVMNEMAGCTRDEEASKVLKHFARKYSEANGLEIRGGKGEQKNFEYFHRTAVEHAIAKFKAD